MYVPVYCFPLPEVVFQSDMYVHLNLSARQVTDDAGNDVTPQPLIQLDPNTVRKNQSNILADSSAGTVRINLFQRTLALCCLLNFRQSQIKVQNEDFYVSDVYSMFKRSVTIKSDLRQNISRQKKKKKKSI